MVHGYESCSKQKGGIRSIKLIEASDFLSCSFDSSLNCFSNYNLSEGAEFCNICYFEDSANYTEQTTLDHGHSRISHKLSFSLTDSNQQTLNFIDRLTEGSIKDIIAIIEDNNSQALLIGYSNLFLNQRPLRLSVSNSDLGYTPSSRPMQTITLLSEDTSRALKLI